MADNPLTGVRYFLRGFSLIVRPGIRRYVIVPLVINATLFAALLWFGIAELGELIDAALPSWLDWLRWLLWPLLLICFLVIGFFSFNLVANLIAAPFNGLLAEAVERHLTGQELSPGSFAKLALELWRTLGSELRKLVYIAVRIVPLLLLLPFPGLNLIASLALMVLSAWMLAIAYADYPMANHGLTFSDQRRRLGEQRLLSLGFGASVMAALAVPLLNFVVIPCAVAGATAMWVERLRGPIPDAARGADQSQ